MIIVVIVEEYCVAVAMSLRVLDENIDEYSHIV